MIRPNRITGSVPAFWPPGKLIPTHGWLVTNFDESPIGAKGNASPGFEILINALSERE
jgi:hypothetical protein